MKDRSHLEEMRAAIRGDLERNRARGQSSGLLVPEPGIEPEPEPQREPAPPVQEEPEPEPRPGIFGSLFKRR